MKDDNKFYLSNSMMRSWETECHIKWKERYINQNPFLDYTTDAMERGNVFETMVIGVSVGKKVSMPSEKLRKSVYYERIVKQAKSAKEYLKSLGGKILAVQEELKGEFTDLEGRTVRIKGALDIRYGWADKYAIRDLKFTGDKDNDFGDYGWGNIEQMDCSQAFQYDLLCRLNFPNLPDPEFYYDIWDSSPEMKEEHFQIVMSDYSKEQHKVRLSKAYHEIVGSIETDAWAPTTNYNECKRCPVKCEHQIKSPPIKIIQK